ncbi:hypothetical protein B0F87_107148 [Methylobacter tundripaludum]|uniref:Uncharacterized protein n=1 Tax=Methylobacter tundripaludum TaxID=173365 RepID=A0A2S6HBN6_9GAMM|nr:hypothetical protein B0F87_107148 [Methylobacter tundripaludum]
MILIVMLITFIGCPVKHGWVCQVADWPHSSFFKFVKMGVYPMTWGHSGEFDFDAGE